MRVARARRRLELPEHRHLRVHALDAVVDLAVGVRVQVAVGLHVLAQEVGTGRQLRHLRELRRADHGGPALRAENLDVLREIQDLAGEALPLHEIDEVRGDVDEAFALLRHVEEPRRPLDRRAGDPLGKVVHALLDDSRLAHGALQQLPEHGGNPRERLLQHRGDLVPLGHDVPEQHATGPGVGERLLQRFEARGVDGHRLVGEHVHAGVHRAGHEFGLAPVVAGDDDDVAGPLGAEPVQEIGAGVDLHSPRGRGFGARVVACHLLQVVGEVGTFLGIDVHRGVDVRIHRLLQQRRMEMAGSEHDQFHGGSGLPPGRPKGGLAPPRGAANAVSVGVHHPSMPCTRRNARILCAASSGSRSSPAASASRNTSDRWRRLRALCCPPTIVKCG